jgi:hypothetical protein
MGRGWKGGVQFTSNLGPRWTGSYHDKEGFQVSKREVGLEKEETSKGSKTRGCAIIVLLSVLLIVYMYITIV